MLMRMAYTPTTKPTKYINLSQIINKSIIKIPFPHFYLKHALYVERLESSPNFISIVYNMVIRKRVCVCAFSRIPTGNAVADQPMFVRREF